MPGLVPGTYHYPRESGVSAKIVGGRNKCGHDADGPALVMAGVVRP